MKNLVLSILVLPLVSCGSGFGEVCNEDHKAVKLARSLSQEQLASLYVEMYKLRNTKTPEVEYSDVAVRKNIRPIPQNLKFINAGILRPSAHLNPEILLAGCLDEFIYLRFYGDKDKKPRIELSWFSGPYSVEKEILWEKSG